MTCETLQKGPIKDLFSSCTWSNHTPRQANKCSTNANCFLEKNLFYRCARMDFVAKILIDQQDIAGRMSRGGECCEINLASMQLPLGISALVVELLFKSELYWSERGMYIQNKQNWTKDGQNAALWSRDPKAKYTHMLLTDVAMHNNKTNDLLMLWMSWKSLFMRLWLSCILSCISQQHVLEGMKQGSSP